MNHLKGMIFCLGDKMTCIIEYLQILKEINNVLATRLQKLVHTKCMFCMLYFLCRYFFQYPAYLDPIMQYRKFQF
jgi:hypothetical protein